MLLKLALGTLPASIRALKPISVVMKPLTSFIMICAAFQLVSTLPLLPSCSMKMHAAVTSSTPGGGLPSDLSSPRSFLLRPSRASAAAASAGSAAARSFSMLSFMRLTSASFLAASSATLLG